MTCVHVGVKNVRFLEKVVLPHGGVPVGRDFLSRDIARYPATGATIKVVTYVPIVPIIERVRVRQVISPRLSVLAQLGRHGQRGCVVPLPINVVPAKALGDEFAVAPIGLQVAAIVRDTHRPVGEYLLQKFRLIVQLLWS